jgi:hypothetical protein
MEMVSQSQSHGIVVFYPHCSGNFKPGTASRDVVEKPRNRSQCLNLAAALVDRLNIAP